MRDVEDTIDLFKQIKAMGVHLSIDDFGTGYSSLSYLRRFSLDTLKIDRSFVREDTTKADDRAIISAIIAMAQSLSLSVVAEGVETRAQSELLQALGCHIMQGYLYGKPVPALEFATLLRGGRPSKAHGRAYQVTAMPGLAGPASCAPVGANA